MASTNYKRVLNEFAAKEDKKFVKYGEQKDVHKACIHQRESEKTRGSLACAESHQFEFDPHGDAEIDLLGKTLNQFRNQWNIHVKHQPDWVRTMTHR